MDKPTVLLIESNVQEIDTTRREHLATKFNFLHYDCSSVQDFISRLQPGQAYSNIHAFLRTGWLKSGPYSSHQLFTTEVITHYPPSLKFISCSGHGYDFADMDALTRKGIWFCNTPDACTEAVANTALSLVLETFRYLTYAQWCARFDWMKSRDLGAKAIDPQGQSLGVVGLGDIGLAAAKKCHAAFGMHIHYHGPRRKVDAEAALPGGAIYHDSLHHMIQTVDCILLAAPYTKATHHLLSKAEFDLAKPSGLRVVNIARGKMIDEIALIEALRNGKVVGAGLDVHENEPAINETLRNDWKVTLLPHIGVCSRTSWANFERQQLDSLEEWYDGKRPLAAVNSID